MPDFTSIQSGLMLGLWIFMLVVKGIALVDCILRPQTQIQAAGPLDKRTWLVFLGLAMVAHLVVTNPLNVLAIVGMALAIVYLARVRSHVGS